jgi:tripartite-type tricarboxylate transporter receptor subunit TctC
MKSKCILTGAILAILLPASVLAQSYPAKPVRIVVPLVPGGNLDIVARAVAQRLGEGLGQQVIVENRPGASSLVGTQFVAKSAPDGYTLLAMANTFASVPAVIAKPGYDPVKDFTGVSMTCKVPQVLVVTPTLPAKSVKDLIALAKKSGSNLSYSTPGVGNTQHLAGELFNARAGTQIVHVPYKGAGQAITGVLTGETAMMFATAPLGLPHIKAGKLKPLAYTCAKRVSFLPDVPTISEAGFPQMTMEPMSWYGMLAPAATPPAIVTRLSAEAQTAVKSPLVRERLDTLQLEPAGSSSDEFRRFVDEQVKKFAELLKLAKVEPE